MAIESRINGINIKVEQPVTRRPLANPGVRNYRTDFSNPLDLDRRGDNYRVKNQCRDKI